MSAKKDEPTGLSIDQTVGGTTLTASLDEDGSVSVVIARDGHTIHHFNYKTPPETRPDITA